MKFIAKIFILLLLMNHTKPFLGIIKKITGNPIVNIAIILLLLFATCLEKAKLMCPIDLLDDIGKTTFNEWGRKLQQNNPLFIVNENLENYKKYRKELEKITNQDYLDFARFLKKRNFNLNRH